MKQTFKIKDNKTIPMVIIFSSCFNGLKISTHTKSGRIILAINQTVAKNMFGYADFQFGASDLTEAP